MKKRENGDEINHASFLYSHRKLLETKMNVSSYSKEEINDSFQTFLCKYFERVANRCINQILKNS